MGISSGQYKVREINSSARIIEVYFYEQLSRSSPTYYDKELAPMLKRTSENIREALGEGRPTIDKLFIVSQRWWFRMELQEINASIYQVLIGF